jgi:hypothetical protein
MGVRRVNPIFFDRRRHGIDPRRYITQLLTNLPMAPIHRPSWGRHLKPSICLPSLVNEVVVGLMPLVNRRNLSHIAILLPRARRSFYRSAIVGSSKAFRSGLPLIHAGNPATDHLGDDFYPLTQFETGRFGQELPAKGEFHKGHAFLSRCAGDNEEILPIGLGESAIALGDIRGNRQRGAVQLIGEEIMAAREGLGESGDFFGEIQGLLIDRQIFEHEGHERAYRMSR